MSVMSVCRRLFAKRPQTEVTTQQKPAVFHISEFNNVWNQLAAELAKPSLNPNWKVDSEKVARLKKRLDDLQH